MFGCGVCQLDTNEFNEIKIVGCTISCLIRNTSQFGIKTRFLLILLNRGGKNKIGARSHFICQDEVSSFFFFCQAMAYAHV